MCLVALCMCVAVCLGQDGLALARAYNDDELSELVRGKVDGPQQHKEQRVNSGGTTKTQHGPPKV